MLATLKPIGYALFVWWFSTGAIIWLDGLPRRTFRWSLLGATLLFGISLVGIRESALHTTLEAAYESFTFALLAWAWHEITFYMGAVTGPRKQVCLAGCSGWAHFGHAIQVSLWHELAILVSVMTIAILTWSAPNHVALWTFLVLYGMHQSAKINVFLGVRNLNEQFLPEHLDFLRSFLTSKPMNLLFPLSITLSTVLVAQFGTHALNAAAGGFEAASWLFITTLMTVAILEHWFLVVPLPAEALWSWGLQSRAAITPFTVDVVAGFLGSGKTTVMRRLLAEVNPEQRTVVLSNDFSDLGIDGSLLAGRGAEVIELANGCICCSLQKDLAKQLLKIARHQRPARVLIEPSGVADVAALIVALGSPALAPLVRSLRVLSVVDAGAFLGDFARMPSYFEAQTRVSPLVLVNKTDLVHEGSLDIIRHTLLGLHPTVRIAMAQFGLPADGALLDSLLAALPVRAPSTGATPSRRAKVQAPWRQVSHALDQAPGQVAARAVTTEGQIALGLQSWSAALPGVCDPHHLRSLLDQLAEGQFGQLERVKGIVRADTGWMRFDLAGGRATIAAHAAAVDESPRVMAIGRDVDGPRLLKAFADCTLPGAMQHG